NCSINCCPDSSCEKMGMSGSTARTAGRALSWAESRTEVVPICPGGQFRVRSAMTQRESRASSVGRKRPLDGDPEGANLGPQVGAADPQYLGRPDLVPLGVGQDAGEEVALHDGERLGVEVLGPFPEAVVEELFPAGQPLRGGRSGDPQLRPQKGGQELWDED